MKECAGWPSRRTFAPEASFGRVRARALATSAASAEFVPALDVLASAEAGERSFAVARDGAGVDDPSYGTEWTMTGPAVAVACPMKKEARFSLAQARARRFDSSASSTLLKMLIAVTVSSGA